MHLKAGDRLEPTPSLLDISKFELQPPPFRATFWRMTSDDRVSHRSPLWQIEGMFADRHFIDILHTWHLGPLTSFIPFTLRFIINSGILVPRMAHPAGRLSAARRSATEAGTLVHASCRSPVEEDAQRGVEPYGENAHGQKASNLHQGCRIKRSLEICAPYDDQV